MRLARAALLILATLGSCLGAERLARVCAPQLDPASQLAFVAHGPLWLGRPFAVQRMAKNTGDYDVELRFGPRGFRDARDVAKAAQGDVLFVGDSFTFGWGVDEQKRFSSRFEAVRRVRAFNLGIPGAGLEQYAALVRYATQLGAQARTLVIGLSMETDLDAPSSTRDARGDAEDRGTAPVSSPPVQRAKAWLAGHSALYALASAAVHRTPALRALAVRLGVLTPNLAVAGAPPYSKARVRFVADTLAELARGYDATVLIIPSRGLWLELQQRDEDRLHREVVDGLVKRGLHVVDPRAVFEASKRPLTFHFEHDGHWNARGHAVAAELLASAVRMHAGSSQLLEHDEQRGKR
jgi:hypothetical protein